MGLVHRLRGAVCRAVATRRSIPRYKHQTVCSSMVAAMACLYCSLPGRIVSNLASSNSSIAYSYRKLASCPVCVHVHLGPSRVVTLDIRDWGLRNRRVNVRTFLAGIARKRREGPPRLGSRKVVCAMGRRPGHACDDFLRRCSVLADGRTCGFLAFAASVCQLPACGAFRSSYWAVVGEGCSCSGSLEVAFHRSCRSGPVIL